MRLPLDASIAVVGAGASGLSFAAEMQAMGYQRVVLFEREATAGGKCATVSVDGRAHDLGATMGVPIDYRPVLRFSREAGIRTVRFPDERHLSTTTGGDVALNTWRELPGVFAQAARYFRLHRGWAGVDGSGLHHAPAELHRPFSELVERHRLDAVAKRTLCYRTGYGYGHDDEVPAVYHANLFRPETFLGLALGHAFMWDGGTQPIWQKLAERLEVRTRSAIDRVERTGDGVIVHSRGRRERFDALVITVDPRQALRFLDASSEERGWFSQVKTHPYATFACEVDGLDEGKASIGYLDENMTKDRPGHPMAWVKRYPDQGVFVFHLFAPDDLGDDEIARRIGADMAALGGRLRAVRASRRWAFFPHFPTSFMEAGGLAALDAWQGTTRAYLIGECLSYATMSRVAGLATRFARELAQVGLSAPIAVAEPLRRAA